MLGGQDPIIIFQLSKLADTGFAQRLSRIPLVSEIPTLVEMPPIPVYLNEQLTGVYIDSESKNIDIETETETLENGAEPEVNQKGIGSGVTINMFAKKDSLGLTLIAALLDVVFDKVTSKEYAITYINGPTTIFRAVLRSFAIDQNAENELATIKIELTKGSKQPKKIEPTVTVPGSVGTLPGG